MAAGVVGGQPLLPQKVPASLPARTQRQTPRMWVTAGCMHACAGAPPFAVCLLVRLSCSCISFLNQVIDELAFLTGQDAYGLLSSGVLFGKLLAGHREWRCLGMCPKVIAKPVLEGMPNEVAPASHTHSCPSSFCARD
eukprot:scaffold6160_cov19-Tisochrysis_lutea.AAC.2